MELQKTPNSKNNLEKVKQEYVDNWRGYAYVGARGIWNISVPYSQFFCEPKTAL